MPAKVLLSDISNGSYFTLALAEPGKRHEATAKYACTHIDQFYDSVRSFLSDNGDPTLRGAAFSTSGWEVDGHVDLVHYGFNLNRTELKSLLNVQRLNLVNNFVAKALSVPMLKLEERIKVCGGDEIPEQVTAVVGPTVGFGGALLAPDGMGGWTASHCEGGHSDLAPTNELEIDILRLLMKKYGHVSRERAVSMQGMSDVWQCLCVLEGDPDDAAISPDEIVARASTGDERALKTIRIIIELFAATASDFALIMGARGGIYLTGELLPLLGDLFDHEVFADRFYDKGRVSSYVRDIPVFQIIAPEIEIIGLATLFE